MVNQSDSMKLRLAVMRFIYLHTWYVINPRILVYPDAPLTLRVIPTFSVSVVVSVV